MPNNSNGPPRAEGRAPRLASALTDDLAPGLSNGSRSLRQRRRDDGRAFMPDVEPGYAHAPDSLAENLAEQFLESATSGEERGEEMMNEFVPEDIGGPFLEELQSEDEDDET